MGRSVTTFTHALRPWLVTAAKVVVVLSSLAIIYLLTSGWVTVAVAAGFAAVVVAVKALSRASRQIDRIFEEEFDR